MARSGLYKSDVQRARDSLRAEGKNPSVDAVRVALGNTGSKTTIHRYLKELEEEDGQGLGAKIAISDVLQDLVVRRPNGCMPRPKRWSPRSRRGSKPSCTSAPKPWNKPGKRPATSVRSFSAPRPCYRQSARRAKSPGDLASRITELAQLEERIAGLTARLTEHESHARPRAEARACEGGP